MPQYTHQRAIYRAYFQQAPLQDECRPLQEWEAIYPIPNPLDTLQAWQRYTHADLPVLSLLALMREFKRLRLRLLLDEHPDQWLTEREAALRQAIATRRRDSDLSQEAGHPQPREGFEALSNNKSTHAQRLRRRPIPMPADDPWLGARSQRHGVPPAVLRGATP